MHMYSGTKVINVAVVQVCTCTVCAVYVFSLECHSLMGSWCMITVLTMGASPDLVQTGRKRRKTRRESSEYVLILEFLFYTQTCIRIHVFSTIGSNVNAFVHVCMTIEHFSNFNYVGCCL